jgi:hypothetical protein
MPVDLDAPEGPASSWAAQIWRGRGEETPLHRPVTTGDVFRAAINVTTKVQNPEERTFIVLQHPCTMRPDGLNTRNGILVAVVSKGSKRNIWPTDRHFNKMVLPELQPPTGTPDDERVECWEADFDVLAVVDAESLDPAKRIASMELFGIALTLQRLTHYLTRTKIPVFDFATTIESADAEIEIIENWVETAIGAGENPTVAAGNCLQWLREDDINTTRQKALEEPALRSRIRREAISRARELYK